MKWATFVNDHSTEIQFIQPGPGTPLGDRLEKVGEHVHHLCFSTDDVPGAMEKLKAEGIQVLGDGKTYNDPDMTRSEEHTSELQSLMRISYAVFCLKKKKSY